MMCILGVSPTAIIVDCIRFHPIKVEKTSIPNTYYIRRYLTKSTMKEAGWSWTPNGWLCPDCSKFKRSIERRILNENPSPRS